MPFKRSLKDERGVILVITLLIIALLIGAGAGAMALVQTDLKISANLKNGTQAFYLAEAGIEWAKQQIKNAAANPPYLIRTTQNLSPGTFTVHFEEPTKVTKLSSTVAVQSTGTFGRSSSIVQALVTKTYQLADAALSIRGDELDAVFKGKTFLVDGKDYNPATGELVEGTQSRFGISVASLKAKSAVIDELSGQQASRVVGKGGTTPSVEKTSFLSSDEVARIANDLCNAPGAIVQDIVSSGTLRISGNTTYGTRGSPGLYCFNGSAILGDKVDIEGNFNGAGILVVRDADLVASDNFHWEGIIIVSGTGVGFRVKGKGDKNIFGSLMINERGTDTETGTEEIRLEGAVKLRYSSSALTIAAELFPLSALEPIYGSIPSSLEQKYWRTVTD
ncbi:MAG: hypothetical protein O7G28_07515 [Deltaproteobacteria bacterium]|nr:hypothetical protein [Deltaproteobacteria bacterium]MCZ6907115.1 hypothetical protein [Deltaproteobacteria bacterium]